MKTLSSFKHHKISIKLKSDKFDKNFRVVIKNKNFFPISIKDFEFTILETAESYFQETVKHIINRIALNDPSLFVTLPNTSKFEPDRTIEPPIFQIVSEGYNPK